MTTLAGSNPTLMDWAKLQGPDGKIMPIVDMLGQTNEMLMDMVWQEANGPTSHRVSILTGLPQPTWRQFYKGVQPSKMSTAQVDEAIGMMEDRSVCDFDLANLNGDVNAFRLAKAGPHMEGINQEMQQTVLYGTQATAAEEFNGLSPRYNALSTATAATAENVVDGEGVGSVNTSIWLIGWGEEKVYGVFPKGMTAGVQHEDLGVDHNTPDGQTPVGYYSAYHDKWMWKAGLVVADWRYCVRIANIDVSNLTAESSAADILKLMAIAVDKIPALGAVRPAFYANRTIRTMLRIQAMQKANLYLTVGQEEGKHKVSFDGIPIRMCDQILNTESAVS